jgi:hypothetical protein
MPERVTGPAFYFPSIEKRYGKPVSHWLDIMDELQLLVHPVIAGAGARLFEGFGDHLPLTLAHSHAHGNGVVALHYTLAA